LSGCDATYSRISLSLKRQWWWGWARPRTGIWVRHIVATQHIEHNYIDTTSCVFHFCIQSKVARGRRCAMAPHLWENLLIFFTLIRQVIRSIYEK